MRWRRTLIRWAAALLVILGIGLGFYFYWRYQARFPTTADAYLQAHVVQIAPQVSGKVLQVYAQENQPLAAGEPLLLIDPQPFQIALELAKARYDATRQEVTAAQAAVQAAEAMVAERQAQLSQAQQNVDRIVPLVRQQLQSPAEGDAARDALAAAKAQLAAARSELELARRKLGEPGADNAALRAAGAAVAQAELDLEHARVQAPVSGTVANLTLRPGSVVERDTPLFAMVEQGRWWVEANYKETDLLRIAPGMAATISVDMYPGIHFRGVVESISPASGVAFSLFPPENATGNWVKVTQRFPVRVLVTDPDPVHPLRMGASAEVTIDTLAARRPLPAEPAGGQR